jgi:PAS domain S-box-containing protein
MPETIAAPRISGAFRNEVPNTQPDFPEKDIRILTPDLAMNLLHELRVHQHELTTQNEELKQIQAALEISRTQYFDLYHLAPVGYFTLSQEGLILTTNLTGATILDREMEMLAGRPLSRYILQADQEIYYHHHRLLFETGLPQVFEIRIIKKSGNEFWARIEATLKTDADDPPVCRAVFSDITDRKQAEKTRLRLENQLHQVRKAESLGRMAGAIAHHFNNLLGVVMGNLELSTQELLQGSKLQTFISEALNASRRAADISTLMLAYIGQTIANRKPADVIALCTNTLPILRTALPKNAQLKTEFPPRAPVVQADEIHLRRALINLIINAGESLPEQKGDVTLSIRTISATDIPSEQIYPQGWKPDKGEYACISVADTGCGIDARNLDNLFDPFFSTKFTGRGLGLSVVLGTAKAHDGAVAVESKIGHGSRFHLFLPLLAVKPVQPPKPVDPLPPPETPDRGMVLLVEDEPALRKLAETMLKHMGHEVVSAEDGMAAIDVFNQHQAKIGCVLLDVTMPRRGGWETLAALRAICPGLPAILTSGYDEMQVMADAHAELPQAFLKKPYQLAGLKAAVEKARRTHSHDK